jgi:hypothetical protein
MCAFVTSAIASFLRDSLAILQYLRSLAVARQRSAHKVLYAIENDSQAFARFQRFKRFPFRSMTVMVLQPMLQVPSGVDGLADDAPWKRTGEKWWCNLLARFPFAGQSPLVRWRSTGPRIADA